MSSIVTMAKIDLCGSKSFAGTRERSDPSIRTRTLNQLLDVSKRAFPHSDKPYPEGSFYKADGDAVFYLLEKPTVALRSSIEFMQSWFHESVPEYPDCRVFLDRGHVEPVVVPGKIELTGKAFENLSVFEKDQQPGRVYLTDSLMKQLDTTMAKFRRLGDVSPREGEVLRIYVVDFDDPRTVRDSSLVHALFVAHPQAEEARERLFELFLVEYLLERNTLSNMQTLLAWLKEKEYSVPPEKHLRAILEKSPTFTQRPNGEFTLADDTVEELRKARIEFRNAREECINAVKGEINQKTDRAESTVGVDLGALIEDYLCQVFSEIRMMANYFRETSHLFESGPEVFAKFDYVLRRSLDEARLEYFSSWRNGFIAGLRVAAGEENEFIAAVFHNVLATYYLNRSGKTSPYQLKKLQERQVYLDTNVFYSLRVEASQFHDATAYFVDRLSGMGILTRLLPVSLDEYEQSLEHVERNYGRTGPSDLMVQKNPWLHQEFQSKQAEYLSSIAICRDRHSIAKGLEVIEENHEELRARLQEVGVHLEKEYEVLEDVEAEKLWSELRNQMASNKWDLARYWEHIYKQVPLSVKVHDMTCLAKLEAQSRLRGGDALGPRTLFVTVDSKLWRLRRKYSFIVSPEQFLEFVLPYLFLSDIPISDAETFPNRLLASQLGTLLVRRPPQLAEMIGAYFRNPSLAGQPVSEVFRDVTEEDARVLSEQRFQSTVERSAPLTESQREEVGTQTARYYVELTDLRRQTSEAASEVERLRKLLTDSEEKRKRSEQQTRKLQKTVKYLKRHRGDSE